MLSAIKYIQESKALWENLLAGNGAEELSKISLYSCGFPAFSLYDVYLLLLIYNLQSCLLRETQHSTVLIF